MDCQAGKRHYEVVSPPMVFYPYNGPPEEDACWGFYLAKNAKDAIRQAVADPAFSEWVNEQRADNQPPFKGLKASRTLCEHDVCWGCGAADNPICPECQNSLDEWEKLTVATWES